MRLLHAVGLAGALLLSIALIAGAQESPAAWTVGSRVHAGSAVCARATAVSSAPCGTLEPAGTKGTIRAGPVTDAAVVFWSVAFDGSVTGWARQLYLTLDTLGVPNPPPPPPPPQVVTGAPRTVTIGGLVQMIGVTVGSAFTVAALPLDSTGTLTAAPVTWSASDSSVVKILPAVSGLTQAASLTALRVGSTLVTASAAGLARTMTFTGLPVDTTRTVVTVTGVQVTNLPSQPYFGLLPGKPIYSGTYLVNLIGVVGDTVKRAVCVVPK